MPEIKLRVTADDNDLADVVIPEEAVPKLQEAFGGASAQETAANFLAFVVRSAKPAIKRILRDQAEASARPTFNDAIAQAETEFETAWPDQKA